MRETARRILHVDLDPFFVSVERSLDPSLRGRPVIVGSDAGASGFVAAASDEARSAGVRPGQSLAAARRLCPDAAFRAGDLEAYARVSEEVTGILLAASRRVERPSADEAYVDLTPESGARNTLTAVEVVKDELQRRLGLDAALGLANSRLAARVASSFAKPRGFVVVLPGYESSFLSGKPLSFLEDLPSHLEAALERAGFGSLGQIAEADPQLIAAAVGPAAAARIQEAARGDLEEPVALAARPQWIQEQATIRDRRSDAVGLLGVLEGLVARAARRLRPFGLGAQLVTVEVARRDEASRRSEPLPCATADEERLLSAGRAACAGLLEPAAGVRSLLVRLGRLEAPGLQGVLFPEAGARRR